MTLPHLQLACVHMPCRQSATRCLRTRMCVRACVRRYHVDSLLTMYDLYRHLGENQYAEVCVHYVHGVAASTLSPVWLRKLKA